MSEKLTAKESRFVEEYLVDLNATAAAKRAGYSERTASAIGHELMQRPRVQTAIVDGQRLISVRTHVTQDRVLLELARIAFADLGKAYDINGRLLKVQEIPEDLRRALAGVEVDEIGVAGSTTGIGVTTKVKLLDKTGALTQLGKHLGLLKDTTKHELGESLEALVLASIAKKPEGT